MHTGDMVDSSTEENYELFFRTMSKLKYPYLNAFGNHESYGNMSKGEILQTIKENNRNYIFDDTYYAITPKTDYRIIFLDSTIENADTSNGELSREQLDFLNKELSENQDKIVIIAMHHPSVEPFISKEHSLLNADEFNEILLKYKNPIVVLSGHYHATKIRRIGNLIFVSTPSLVTYPMACRHIKITNFKDRVQYKFEFVNTRLDEIKEQNRQQVISYSALEGLEKDRNLEFTYYKRHPKSANYKRNQIKKASKPAKTSKRELKKLQKNNNEKSSKKREKKIKSKKNKQKTESQEI
jgi:hypothetical protein